MAALMQTAADKLATGGLFQQASDSQASMPSSTTGASTPLAQAGPDTGASSSATGAGSTSLGTAPEPNVSERVAQITSSGSPLMQLAATRAAQDANARGLRSSSIAVGAGQAAVIGAATPLAQGDASFALSQKQIGNQADQAAQQLKTQQDQFAATQSQNLGMFNADLGQKKDQQALDRQQQVTLAKMDAQSRADLVQLQTQSQQDVQGSQNISNAWGTMMQSIQAIQNNPDMEQATKAQLIKNNMDSFAAFSTFWKKLSGPTADVSDLLNFSMSTPTDTLGGAKAAPVTSLPTEPAMPADYGNNQGS
jgi:hypothetical protein